jgi:hypothetical protein
MTVCVKAKAVAATWLVTAAGGSARAAPALPAVRVGRPAGQCCVMAKIGYARVSTRSQNDDSQVDDLTAYGCGKIFTDKTSGKLAAPSWTRRWPTCARATCWSSSGRPARCGR